VPGRVIFVIADRLRWPPGGQVAGRAGSRARTNPRDPRRSGGRFQLADMLPGWSSSRERGGSVHHRLGRAGAAARAAPDSGRYRRARLLSAFIGASSQRATRRSGRANVRDAKEGARTEAEIRPRDRSRGPVSESVLEGAIQFALSAAGAQRPEISGRRWRRPRRPTFSAHRASRRNPRRKSA